MEYFKRVICVLTFTLIVMSLNAQSPHGKELTISCDACHTSTSWSVSKDSITFNHDSTQFLLQGRHTIIDCKECHSTLEFSKAETSCVSCHIDIHQQTVGQECSRCHNSNSWLVDNIAEIHRQISFPLLGAHGVAQCVECHKSETNLRFETMGTECISCHKKDFDATINPDHKKAGFSTECIECHKIDAFQWTASGINHDFFPLTQGHSINECASCHKGADYSKISPECITCHEADFKGTNNPNHQLANFSTSCAECHTTTPGWKPAEFRQHDLQFFPIYSGAHNGQWDKCVDCHTDPGSFTSFTCVTCHKNPETDNKHSGISGYSYNSTACLACHPDGKADGSFDHNSTNFPLTGAHSTLECLKCHATGFSGTPTECVACHATDFQLSTNPNHNNLGLSTDCATCHTTTPGWAPAKFPNHNDFYVLSGAHATIANQCATCHQGEYNNTPSTCVGCHLQDYNQTTDPSHTTLQFSTDCASCHSENAWSPATFDHDNQYFPIYSGKHEGVWDKCVDCHTNPSNYSEYTCVTCHANPETDNQHSGVSGYSYNSSVCLACHPTGENNGSFDHNGTSFPLTGAHNGVECISCHANGFAGTPTECISCHSADFNQSINPNHTSLGLSTECTTCHTTAPGWSPAKFPNHNDFYVLTDAHAKIASECAACHQGEYNNTPTTCVGCHLQEYNQTTDPSHAALQFSTDCASCHTESSWQPATFDHDAQHFPIYSGAHAGVWNQCVDCHTNPSNYSVYTCVTCHMNVETNQQHTGVSGYIYENSACFACHPTGDGQGSFDHNNSNFPLTGAHTTVSCAECHSAGYQGTPTECIACHSQNFNQSANPGHITLGLSTDCITCHTTAPGWNPALFPDHNNFYPLLGAHAAIANQCATCHNGNYTTTPNTCVGCHQSDYNQTNNPSHIALNFSTDCASCHTQSAWLPAEYTDHDANYFPIYSGGHMGAWDQCTDCHTNPNNYAVYTCVTCHMNPETNQQHAGVSGYIYENSACFACHPTGDGQGSFDHNNSNFPLTGAHTTVSCAECHSAGYQGTPTECSACHLQNFNQSTNPGHISLGLSTDCITCHTTTPGWNPALFPDHNNFYPLLGAHAAIANQCATCHNGNYTTTPNTCVGCHQSDYNQTNNPSHIALNFSTDCASCHTQSAWLPAEYTDHDANYFPIYSGGHMGAWDQCTDCHTNPNNYSVYTCVTCHMNPETNQQHAGVSGYIYENSACFACHPTGDAQGAFDHNNSNFPLTGAHTTVSCAECHSGGYQGTPTECSACHLTNFNQSTNPGHISLGLSTDCITCHTTAPGWNPALFPDHNNFYPLLGAHAAIANQCATCHNGNYNNTPNTCVGCHLNDYNQTNNPSHTALNFSTDCASCHTQNAWVPAEYTDHDNMYFPIYSGGHLGAWSQCTDCHTNPNNYGVYTCVTCHMNPETNQQHAGVSGYIYENSACFACHPTGDAQGAFDHNNSNFPLTGAHTTVSCAECHSGGYQGTPTECSACHLTNFNQSTNPGHISLGLSTDCITCHTTAPNWNPALFPDHNNYYPLLGAHAAIANQCATCHNGNYNNTPNTCVGCHLNDYNQTNNPSHTALNFSTDCASCHTQNAWVPAEYTDHDNTYFPIYSGGHMGAWSQCTDCHTNPNNYAVYTCVTCHMNPETNQQHAGISGYVYENSACFACHPTGEAQGAFDHNNSNFPLTGAHITVNCIECHAGGYQGTPTECSACHLTNYNQSANPNHTSLGLSTDCITCHTTAPNWNPALFPDHNNYYPLLGAHAAIANQCATCHNGNYNNTPNTCVGCHLSDYNQTNNPSHIALNFSTDCASCHTQNAWVPAEYTDHDNTYFPIYSGGHMGAWSQCTDCHTNPNNYAVYTCVTCHMNPETNQQHAGISGYIYENSACFACHPTGEAQGAFDHNNSNFPLTGAHTSVSCIECHAGGYQGTPTTCNACHLPDYNQATNPNHISLGLSTDCITCHTTSPDWNPALFPDHNNFYPLLGAHAAIANQCATCHNGNYNNTPNTCVGCHLNDYNQTNNPSHTALNFSTDCASCHTQNAWVPAEYTDHDNTYFPIYSGGHMGAWSQCTDCHTNTNNYAVYTCVSCHTNPETNQQHAGVNGYIYQNAACFACHPTGSAQGAFDHNASNFPLTGAHITVSCVECHAGGYQGTPTACNACHMTDYNQSSNPNHISLGLSTNCTTCHTTAPDWNPALFPNHNAFYPLLGAHAAIANQCATCHNGNYNNTPNTCVGCHLSEYNNTNNPNHQAAQFPTTCATCHTQTAWVPANWNHDNLYFPIYSGHHHNEWNQCSDCHTNPNNYTVFTCITCHHQNQMNNEHQGVNGYQYNSNACYNCHPNGSAN